MTKGIIHKVVLYIIIAGLAFLLIKGGIHCGPDISLPIPDNPPAEPDTIYLDTPPQIIDNVVEKIVYIETPPETVQVIIYSQTPATVDFIGGTITDDGWATIQVLANDSVAHVLEGQMEFYGDSHWQVNPDTSVSFITTRLGWSPGIAAGATVIGVDAYLETLYWNDFLGTGVTVHAPNIGYERDIWGPNEGADYATVSASADFDPWHTPLRGHLGAKFDFGDLWPPGITAGIEARLFSL